MDFIFLVMNKIIAPTTGSSTNMVNNVFVYFVILANLLVNYYIFAFEYTF